MYTCNKLYLSYPRGISNPSPGLSGDLCGGTSKAGCPDVLLNEDPASVNEISPGIGAL